MNMKKFTLITGAAGFLGKIHAETAHEMRHNLILLDLDKKRLSNLAKSLRNINEELEVITFVTDVSNESKLKKISNSLLRAKRYVNVIINNAAIDSKVSMNKKISNSSLENFSQKNWNNELNVGLKGAFLCSKIFGKHMIKLKMGNIINIGSDLSVIAPNQKLYKDSGFKNFVKPVTYSVIKHGILGLTKYIASSWSQHNIRSNCLSLGPIENNHPTKFKSNIKKLIPLSRMGSKLDVENAIKFLLSEESEFMNGHNLIIDGGRTII